MPYLNPGASEEQKMAILHQGGKILSAGAGSGKTFVLIEHLVHRLTNILQTEASSKWEKEIPKILSRIVLMTFTKKAAGEMTIRMMKKIDEICQKGEGEDQIEKSVAFWEIVRKNLNSIQQGFH